VSEKKDRESILLITGIFFFCKLELEPPTANATEERGFGEASISVACQQAIDIATRMLKDNTQTQLPFPLGLCDRNVRHSPLTEIARAKIFFANARLAVLSVPRQSQHGRESVRTQIQQEILGPKI
jgi:hypothetical protein